MATGIACCLAFAIWSMLCGLIGYIYGFRARYSTVLKLQKKILRLEKRIESDDSDALIKIERLQARIKGLQNKLKDEDDEKLLKIGKLQKRIKTLQASSKADEEENLQKVGKLKDKIKTLQNDAKAVEDENLQKLDKAKKRAKTLQERIKMTSKAAEDENLQKLERAKKTAKTLRERIKMLEASSDEDESSGKKKSSDLSKFESSGSKTSGGSSQNESSGKNKSSDLLKDTSKSNSEASKRFELERTKFEAKKRKREPIKRHQFLVGECENNIELDLRILKHPENGDIFDIDLLFVVNPDSKLPMYVHFEADVVGHEMEVRGEARSKGNGSVDCRAVLDVDGSLDVDDLLLVFHDKDKDKGTMEVGVAE